MAHSAVGAYYDRLTRWNRVARAVGYGGGSERLTVHRPLADPRADGQPTSTRLHDLLVEALSPLRAPRVLDAGCGLGGTMLSLAREWGGRYTGLTLSPSQAAIASDAIRGAGLADRIQIQVQSYDEPPPGPYDLVIAIESLVHSANPGVSLAALHRVVAPGGRLAIVDDMPEPSARDTEDLEAFRSGWACGVLWEHEQYRDRLRTLGMTIEHDRDLTPACAPRSLRRIEQLRRLNRAVYRSLPHRGLREVMNSHLGGLSLECLYRDGLMRYRLVIAKR